MQNRTNVSKPVAVDYRRTVQQARVNRARYLSALMNRFKVAPTIRQLFKSLSGTSKLRSSAPASQMLVTMRVKDPTQLMLIISLLFAGAIIGASTLLQSHESADNVTWALVAIWFVPMAILLERIAKRTNSK